MKLKLYSNHCVCSHFDSTILSQFSNSYSLSFPRICSHTEWRSQGLYDLLRDAYPKAETGKTNIRIVFDASNEILCSLLLPEAQNRWVSPDALFPPVRCSARPLLQPPLAAASLLVSLALYVITKSIHFICILPGFRPFGVTEVTSTFLL